ncbi:hypothetical protein [Xanthobacter versatilis]|uniref:hypothetical protein n=1 Tax=Xanthobacter autotrophicus (strain ATCC BAA-1158 / Py2) TaxID=78245 RepID=UPI00372C521C
MFPRFNWMMALRRPDDGGGAGAPGGGGGDPGAGGGAPAGGAPGGAPGGGGAPAGGAPAADPYWRDFLPQHIKADKPEERFDRLATEYKGLRDQIASRPAPPKTAAEYAFEPSDKIKGYFQNPNDPMLGIAREAALEVGLPKDAFGKFVGKIYETAAEKGLLAAPYDPQAEGQKIAERIAPGKSWAEAKPLVVAAVKDAESFAGVLADQLKLGEKAKGLLAGMSDDAAGVEILQALSGAMAKDPAFGAGGAGAGAGSWTKESLDAAVKDPRYNPHSRDYDKAYRARVEAGFRQVYPD